MNLQEQLKRDLHAAMRARDERRKSALRMVLSAIQLAEVEKGELSDDDMILVLQQEVRRREDALKMMQDAGRDDLVRDEVIELDVLRAYLPEQLNAEEIADIARQVIAEVGATSPRDMGAVMKVLVPQLQGKADGRMISQTVRELLSA
ncbi:MAG: GatB/YqeY domain-containing protein [Anaerolineae bacterium]|nr:GatB/YqeY domain-containing protein [Anaerolineae bacterium]